MLRKKLADFLEQFFNRHSTEKVVIPFMRWFVCACEEERRARGVVGAIALTRLLRSTFHLAGGTEQVASRAVIGAPGRVTGLQFNLGVFPFDSGGIYTCV